MRKRKLRFPAFGPALHVAIQERELWLWIRRCWRAWSFRFQSLRCSCIGRFTLERFRPRNLFFIQANMKHFGSETMNRTTRICRHTADTQEAIDLFDIVLEPMLNVRLQRTPGQFSVCIRMWRLRYFELLALLTLVWASALYFPLAVSRSVPGSRSRETWHGHKTSRGGFLRLACAT